MSRAPIVDPNDPRLIVGTPDDQRRARREFERQRVTRAIVATKTEIPRAELNFEALGGRVIEHVASRDGDFYFVFSGDPSYVGHDVRSYFVNVAGDPVLLQRAHNPSSRADVERMLEAREQRKAAKEAAARQRRAQIRAGTT
jgi:hypothetical protein